MVRSGVQRSDGVATILCRAGGEHGVVRCARSEGNHADLATDRASIVRSAITF